ncbi:MAG: hypothetical protein CSA55_01330 [Ilumatobacter coccineus]|uniref:Uncharacterized protein n=1 Tax=Ilumatobacter coccineus TaxID=467094 RepID=A0A2G6KFE1_9ACTN|nr:MAG: hypothetical protein CSA55_01330 [Ilumatobacter coccineus]
MRRCRLVFKLLLVGGVGALAWWMVCNRGSCPKMTASTGPDDLPADDVNTDDVTTDDEPQSTQTWAEPIDGQCPEGYPIKGNADSMIYHVPGGRSYDATIPERCYANEDDAIVDGFRAAKS